MASNTSRGQSPVSSLIWGSDEKTTQIIRVEREHNVFPSQPSHHDRVNLSTFDENLVMVAYDQKGLLYEMSAERISSAVGLLERSLSQVLTTFYPLAGRLATDPSDRAIYIDCNDAGAAFIEASAENVSIADVMAAEVIAAVYQLFPLNDAVNIEGHFLPLLAVQVTKFPDGIFVGCSLNHCVADGVALWHFLNSWAEICNGKNGSVSVNPVYDRSGIPSSPNRSQLRLKFDLDKDISRFSPPPMRIKFFHFTKEMIAGLKDQAKNGRSDSPVPISSLQALFGHVWKAITRARGLGPQDLTTFQISADCRSRIIPPLPSSYFGNSITHARVTSTAGELLSNEICFATELLNGMIRGHDDLSIRRKLYQLQDHPSFVMLAKIQLVKNPLMLGSSPRFKMYETDYGWGKPVAVRSGCGNKIEGKLHVYPGREQDGSMDIEICLVPETMAALENDQHFLNPLEVTYKGTG